ncbi:respiratory nitrate reductase subunit gamma [Sulfuriferula sp.]|uniref:respiratory nitrate reductase subunit gamma n=1 Tax=Sulfuriferula sp. TaxID=2025307 RepID=UPI00272FC014|nr:respiratory nitrate reductase subunit gamma [Sulfuriferula sp.]MDP2026765.1 respiratory nitrate reductase subunit gamma [Sulfuriferula sp.]
MDYLNNLLFGIYPYVALAIFFLGSLIRFDREQYTWKSDSSQLLKRSQLRWGSNLFHIGILFLFFGHAVGLLTPHWLYESMGLTTEAKQLLAMISGGAAGLTCLVGITLLLHRRLTEPRIRATSKPMDIIILLWVFVTLLLGLTSILFSAQHLDGADMLLLANWAQHIVTFRSGAAQFLLAVPLIFKIHLFFGMTLFLLFPFSRLVHVWSGFAAVAYLTRSYQIVRQRG